MSPDKWGNEMKQINLSRQPLSKFGHDYWKIWNKQIGCRCQVWTGETQLSCIIKELTLYANYRPTIGGRFPGNVKQASLDLMHIKGYRLTKEQSERYSCKTFQMKANNRANCEDMNKVFLGSTFFDAEESDHLIKKNYGYQLHQWTKNKGLLHTAAFAFKSRTPSCVD